MFTLAKKQEISQATKVYLDEKGLTLAEFHRNTKFPSAYLSDILNEKFDKEYPKQEHYEKLCDWIGFSYKKEYWQHFDTEVYQEIEGVFLVAKKEQKLCGVDGETGIGKTYALERLARMSSGNYYVKVEPSQSRVDFLENICNTMGLKVASRNTFKMQGAIVERLKNTKEGLLILDECEYISKTHFDMIKTIYDNVKDQAGILISGFGIKELIEKKALSTQGKKGWAQLRRRINQNWNVLPEIGAGSNNWKEVVNEILKELAPKRFSKSALSWLANRSENFDELKTLVTEILMAADDDNVKIISKDYLNNYFV